MKKNILLILILILLSSFSFASEDISESMKKPSEPIEIKQIVKETGPLPEHIDPNFTLEQIHRMLEGFLADRGIISDETVFYDLGLNEINLIDSIKLERSFDESEYIMRPIYLFVFVIKNDNANSVSYELFSGDFDGLTGENIRFDKPIKTIFYNLKTKDDVVELMKDRFGFSENEIKVSLVYYTSSWRVKVDAGSYEVYDNGLIDGPYKAQTTGSSSTSVRQAPRTVASYYPLIFGFIIIVIGLFFLVRKK